MGAIISDRRLYLTADEKRVVEEGDPEAAFLLVGAGGELPSAVAEQYGLIGKKARNAPENKAVEGPGEDKGAAEPTKKPGGRRTGKR